MSWNGRRVAVDYDAMHDLQRATKTADPFCHLGDALRLLRRTRGLKFAHVAEKAGITMAMLSAYECGRQVPSLATLGNILVSLDCRLRELDDLMVAIRAGTRAWEDRLGAPPAG